MPNGHNIYQSASGMAMYTMCAAVYGVYLILARGISLVVTYRTLDVRVMLERPGNP